MKSTSFHICGGSRMGAVLLAAMVVMQAVPVSAHSEEVTPPAAFGRCAVCHNAARGAPAKIGPNLWGVYEKKAASRPGFHYSAALKGSKLRWDDANLNQWIEGPMKMVPGTMMSFPGLKDEAKRAEIIAFLKKAH